MVLKLKPTLSILFVEDDESDFQTIKSHCKQLRNLRLQIFRVLKSADVPSVLESTGASLCFYALASEEVEADNQEMKDLMQRLWQRDINVPVIALGKWRGKDGGVGALRSGATDFLIKSAVRPSILERSIRFALEREKQKEKATLLKKEISVSRSSALPGEPLSENVQFGRLKHLIQGLSRHLAESLTRDLPRAMILRDLQFAARMSKNALQCINEIEHPQGMSTDHYTSVNLQQIVLETGELLNRMLRKNIALSCTPSRGSDIFVHGDPSEIQEMLIHLALNSQEAMPEGGTINISFSLPDSSDNIRSVEVLFRDSGRGIAAEHLGKVFDPAYTTRESTLGFGLGLTVVSATMERHAGTVSISSQEGRGTTVILRFRLLPCEEQLAVVHPSLAEGNGEVNENQVSSHNPAILLYSCFSEEQHLICMYARAAGLETIIASDADQLRSIFESSRTSILALIVDCESLDPEICALIESRAAETRQAIFIVGEDPGSLSEEMMQCEQASFFRRPAEYVFLAASLAELAGNNQG